MTKDILNWCSFIISGYSCKDSYNNPQLMLLHTDKYPSFPMTQQILPPTMSLRVLHFLEYRENPWELSTEFLYDRESHEWTCVDRNLLKQLLPVFLILGRNVSVSFFLYLVLDWHEPLEKCPLIWVHPPYCRLKVEHRTAILFVASDRRSNLMDCLSRCIRYTIVILHLFTSSNIIY